MKKTVIGLNLDYYLKSLVGATIGLISLFLPFAGIGEKKYSALSLFSQLISADGGSRAVIFFYGAVVLTALSILVGAYSSLRTTVTGAKVWQVIQAVSTAFWTLLMFSTKPILEKAGLTNSFLNRDLGIGYWIALAAAYYTLVMIMKMTWTNVGYYSYYPWHYLDVPYTLDRAYSLQGRAGILCWLFHSQGIYL